jgi:hypothetical protein
MLLPAPGRRVFRQTAGAVGVVALLALCATPAAAEDSAPGLVLDEIAPIEGVKPGSTFAVPAGFTNTGTEALDKVWMSYEVSHGLSHTELPSNCRAWKVGGFDEIPVGTKAVCEFDQTVEPGVVYEPGKALRVDALDSALYDSVTVVVSAHDNAPGDEASSGPVQGTGSPLELVARPDAAPAAPGSAPHEDWDRRKAVVTAENTADFQVTGDRLKGRVGDTVNLEVKFTNAGPGWVNNRTTGTPAAQVLIKMPPGTAVTEDHGYCDKLPSGTYRCGTGQAWADEGAGEAYVFQLKIVKAVPGAEGSVALVAEPRPFDHDRTNDTAAITLDVTGAGPTGGSGSTSPGGDDGSTPTGGTGPTGDSGSTGGPSTAGTPATGSPDSTPTSGSLASTGSGSALPLAGAAAAVACVGAGAVVAARRHRAASH